MRKLSFVVLILLLSVFYVRADTEGPLQITAPAGWTVNYESSNGVQAYKLTYPVKKLFVMGFVYWDNLGDVKEISRLMDKTSTHCYESMSRIVKTNKGEFRNPSFFGNYVECTLAPTMTQINFEFSDGTGIWMGEYMGSESNSKKALEMLKGIRKK